MLNSRPPCVYKNPNFYVCGLILYISDASLPDPAAGNLYIKDHCWGPLHSRSNLLNFPNSFTGLAPAAMAYQPGDWLAQAAFGTSFLH